MNGEYKMTNSINYQEIVKETNYTLEQIQRGYILVEAYTGIEVIQKLDDLEIYSIQKFDCDTKAGEQALKDGYKLFTCNADGLDGWYILDTTKVRLRLLNEGWIKSFSELKSARILKEGGFPSEMSYL